MKCKAAEVLHDKKEQAVGAEYGLIFLEFIDCMISDQMMAQHKWRGKRLQWLYDTERHFLSNYISRYVADRGYVKDAHRGRREMTEAERLSDALETTQEQIDKELKAIGFTYDPAELVPRKYRTGWQYRERAKASVRMMWYAQNGGRAAQLYLTSLLKLIHDEKGFGAGRLGKLYDPVAAEVRWYVQKFFVGTDACDAEIKKRIDDAHAEIEACGVELVQVAATGAMEVRKKEDAPVKIPEGMEHLTWDALKNTNNFELTRKGILNYGES